jgi:hypothetical protein
MTFEDQIAEGRLREAFGPEPEETSFTASSGETFTGVPDEENPLETVEFRGCAVEVGDPSQIIKAPGDVIDFRHAVSLLVDRMTETFEDVTQEVFDEAFDLMVQRQKKYGPENINKAGLYGVFSRLEDKMERIKRSMNGRIVNGEIILDEPVDLPDEDVDDGDLDGMNYHAIRILLRRGKWGRPLQSDVEA